MTRILVVDDSPTIRRMVIASLRPLGDVAFDEAGSGLEAIERLALAPADLLVLDLNMPDLYGLEVLRFIRAHERLRATPVLILTTRGDTESRGAALVAGATAYLTKPFDPQELLRHVRASLAPAPRP
jgi:two-component system chemotaxis response regulator CheY